MLTSNLKLECESRKTRIKMDLIKTIEDDANIEYESDESSDEALEAPKKSKIAAKTTTEEFFEEFSFVGVAKDYMKDTWYECLTPYVLVM